MLLQNNVLLFTDWSVDVQVSRGLMLFIVSVPTSEMHHVVGLLGKFISYTINIHGNLKLCILVKIRNKIMTVKYPASARLHVD